MIDLRHPLAVLASRMPWQEIEASLAHRFARQVRTGKQIEDSGLFGPTVITAPFLFDELFALFGEKREEILSMIWDMEEEIMGKDI